jgi:transcriptional repressor NrdR
MYCPFCEHSDTRVIDSRESSEGVRRRRECRLCGQRFNTMERPQRIAMLVLKHDGRREPFNREKIRTGTLLACTKRPVSVEQIESLVTGVERELETSGRVEIPSESIGQLIMQKLRELDRVAYVRFASVYRNFQDIDSFSHEVESLRSASEYESSATVQVDAQIPLPINSTDGEDRQRNIEHVVRNGVRRGARRLR